MAYTLPPYTNQRDWLRECIKAFQPHAPHMADHYEAVLRAVESPSAKTFMYKKGHGPYVEIHSPLGTTWVRK